MQNISGTQAATRVLETARQIAPHERVSAMLVAVFASLLFLYSLVSRRRERTIVTAPIVFAVAGMLTFLIAPEILERKVAALDADAPEHKEMNE